MPASPASLDFLAVSFAAFFAVLVFVDPFFISDRYSQKRLSYWADRRFKENYFTTKTNFLKRKLFFTVHTS
jgi:hypothetical protein